MPKLLHELIAEHAVLAPQRPALLHRDRCISYGELQEEICAARDGLLGLGIGAGERVAVYLPKQPEAVYALFGAAAAGAAFVPVNPLLKPRQVAYILKHCNVRVLVTSRQRLQQLAAALGDCEDLHTVVVVEDDPGEQPRQPPALGAAAFRDRRGAAPHRRIDTDMTAILYTSGSTGNPKGVVLSHRNMVAGAESVASYLGNSREDRLLAVLPLSFDAGLSQLTTAFAAGASVALMDYLLPRDVIRAVVRHGITGLTAVPPLWNQLVGLDWPPEAAASLRYIANTGGAMPKATTRGLQAALPNTDIFLMYGLTEAFRSTFLPPDQVDARPDSIGMAIPHAEVLVVNADGEECAAGEPGELVHRGALVAMGYWNDPEKTAERFRPAPGRPAELPVPELAVWSGDRVMRDEEGYLFFVARQDDMIKTSGYRVSPTEIEEIIYDSGTVTAAVALGLPHAVLGQAILLVVTAAGPGETLEEDLLAHCRRELPNFMVPLAVVQRDAIPQNQNGKLDRRALAGEYRDFFAEQPA